MFQHSQYVPILKWKMGEYQALSRLSEKVKDKITPLIEIPPVGFDFEKKEQRETLDSHLGDFGRRLKSKWQSRPCFVDLKFIPSGTTVSDGIHPLEFIMNQVREEGCFVVPVVGLESDRKLLLAAKRAIRADGRGAALRLTFADFDREDMADDIESVLSTLSVTVADADLVVDLVQPNFLPLKAFVRTLGILYDLIPTPNRWRTLTFVCTSYPPSIAALEDEFAPRLEWLAYKSFVNSTSRDARIPAFGDYGAATPDLIELDMRMIKPLAKLRYTIDDQWYIARGSNVRTNGFGQYQDMCKKLVRRPFFSGRVFSEADRYIADCAKGDEKTGNLSTWVWVATNRHLTKVIADLATLYAS